MHAWPFVFSLAVGISSGLGVVGLSRMQDVLLSSCRLSRTEELLLLVVPFLLVTVGEARVVAVGICGLLGSVLQPIVCLFGAHLPAFLAVLAAEAAVLYSSVSVLIIVSLEAGLRLPSPVPAVFAFGALRQLGRRFSDSAVFALPLSTGLVVAVLWAATSNEEAPGPWPRRWSSLLVTTGLGSALVADRGAAAISSLIALLRLEAADAAVFASLLLMVCAGATALCEQLWEVTGVVIAAVLFGLCAGSGLLHALTMILLAYVVYPVLLTATHDALAASGRELRLPAVRCLSSGACRLLAAVGARMASFADGGELRAASGRQPV